MPKPARTWQHACISYLTCHHVPPCNIPLCNISCHATCHSMFSSTCHHASWGTAGPSSPQTSIPGSQIVTEGCCCQADLVTNLLELVPQLQHFQWHGLLQANHVEPANFLTEATVQKSHGSDYQSMTAQVRTCHVTWCFLALGVAWENGNSWGSDRSWLWTRSLGGVSACTGSLHQGHCHCHLTLCAHVPHWKPEKFMPIHKSKF